MNHSLKLNLSSSNKLTQMDPLTNTSTTKTNRPFNHMIKVVKTESPFLFSSIVLCFFIAIVCIVGLIVDDRIFNGINVWIKPLKFAISSAIYVFTAGFLITLYPYSNRKKKILNNTVAFAMMVDVIIITIQASRGVGSHYNMSSPLDALMYAAMGIFIGIIVLTMLVFIIDTIRLKLKTTKTIQWAILMGWLVVFFGSWVGGQMISQLSHSVAVADGGAGLPFLNWSTIGGDLRIAHFFGLHGIQIIPLFAYWASKKWKSSSRKQIISVTLFGLIYASWIGFTFYQAKQGMALINL